MGKNILLEQARIVRSWRKSIGLEITGDGTLVLRAPYGVSEAELERVVARKAAWITRAQAKIAKEKTEHRPLEKKEGAPFLLLGAPCRLHLQPGRGFALENGILTMGTEENRASLIAFLSRLLGDVLQKQVPYYAGKMNLPVPVVKGSRARSRWGYCNYKGEIGFSWPLVFCPEPVIAYVVVHELCHIRNMSHNKAFWQSVGRILPDYKQREKWLKVHRKVMDTV